MVPGPTDVLAALRSINRRCLAGRPDTLIADVLAIGVDALKAQAGLILWMKPAGELSPGPAVGLPSGAPGDLASRPPFGEMVANPQPTVLDLTHGRPGEPFRWLGALGFTQAIVAPLLGAPARSVRGFGIFCYRTVPVDGLPAVAQTFADQLALAAYVAEIETSNTALRNTVAQQAETQEIFLSAVSHELKGPLTNMQGYSQLLIRYPDAAPAQRQRNLETILAETRRLTRLVNDLTEVARLENGSLDFVLEPVDLRGLVREVADRLAQSPVGGGRAIAVEVPAHLPMGHWDRDRLAEALGNLIEHALNETPPERAVQVAVEQAGDEAVVCIQSSGQPAEAEALRLAFVPFFRLAKPARIKGIGLGLPIARLIVEALGGRVWAEPLPDAGNRYGVRLPFERM